MRACIRERLATLKKADWKPYIIFRRLINFIHYAVDKYNETNIQENKQ